MGFLTSYLQVIGAGLLAGMRSMTAPALISSQLAGGSLEGENAPLGVLGSSKANTAFRLLAIGELVGDKLPGVPARTQLPSLIVRSISGALVGAVINNVKGRSPAIGATVGGAAAIVGTYASYHLRRTMKSALHMPDPVLGAMEDAVVLGAGRVLMNPETLKG